MCTVRSLEYICLIHCTFFQNIVTVRTKPLRYRQTLPRNKIMCQYRKKLFILKFIIQFVFGCFCFLNETFLSLIHIIYLRIKLKSIHSKLYFFDSRFQNRNKICPYRNVTVCTITVWMYFTYLSCYGSFYYF